jgi:hypothetical protein
MTDKERRKSQYQKVRELGLSSSASKQYYNLSEKNFQDKYRKLKQNKSRREKYRIAKERGLTPEQARKTRGKSKKYVDNITKDNITIESLIIGYREYTHGYDPEAVYYSKQYNSKKSSHELNLLILDGLKNGSYGSYIGDTRVDIVTSEEGKNNLLLLYDSTGYIPVYKGNGERLQSLLNALNTTFSILYPDQCARLLFEVIENLRLMSSQKCHNNADYLEKNFMSFFKGRDM